jgi:hypothetical protein
MASLFVPSCPQVEWAQEVCNPGSRAYPDELCIARISNKTITSQGGATLETKRRKAWAEEVDGGEAQHGLEGVSLKVPKEGEGVVEGWARGGWGGGLVSLRRFDPSRCAVTISFVC